MFLEDKKPMLRKSVCITSIAVLLIALISMASFMWQANATDTRQEDKGYVIVNDENELRTFFINGGGVDPDGNSSQKAKLGDSSSTAYWEIEMEEAGDLKIASGNDLTLNLNGRSINLNGNCRFVVDEGATFTVEDTRANNVTLYGQWTDNGTTDKYAKYEVFDASSRPSEKTHSRFKTGVIYGGRTDKNAQPLSKEGQGGAVYCEGTFNMSSGSISGNIASRGGGVALCGNAVANISSKSLLDHGTSDVPVSAYTVFNDNRTYDDPNDTYTSEACGGAFAIDTNTTMSVNGGLFRGNWAFSDGGAIDASGNLTVSGGTKTDDSNYINTYFLENSSKYSGGAITQWENTLNISGYTTFESNSSCEGGAVMVVYDSSQPDDPNNYPELDVCGNAKFIKNIAKNTSTVQGAGGAIEVGSCKSVCIHGDTFMSENYALNYGGGISAFGVTNGLKIYENANITNNSAAWQGGGVYAYTTTYIYGNAKVNSNSVEFETSEEAVAKYGKYANAGAAGVWCGSYGVAFGDSAQVKDNTIESTGNRNNLFVGYSTKHSAEGTINVMETAFDGSSHPLTVDSYIGITAEREITEATPFSISDPTIAYENDYYANFVADKSDSQSVITAKNNHLQLKVITKIYNGDDLDSFLRKGGEGRLENDIVATKDMEVVGVTETQLNMNDNNINLTNDETGESYKINIDKTKNTDNTTKTEKLKIYNKAEKDLVSYGYWDDTNNKFVMGREKPKGITNYQTFEEGVIYGGNSTTGGVINNEGTLDLRTIHIVGNKSEKGAINNISTDVGSVTVSKNTNVASNRKLKDDGTTSSDSLANLYLCNGTKFTFGRGYVEPETGQYIGVSSEEPPTGDKTVTITDACVRDYTLYVHSDAGYEVCLDDASKELYMKATGGITNYSQLKELFATGGTGYLADDIKGDAEAVLKIQNDVTLDMRGHIVNLNEGYISVGTANQGQDVKVNINIYDSTPIVDRRSFYGAWKSGTTTEGKTVDYYDVGVDKEEYKEDIVYSFKGGAFYNGENNGSDGGQSGGEKAIYNSGYGGFITVMPHYTANIELSDITIAGSHANKYGGAVYLTSGSVCTASDVSFFDNHTTDSTSKGGALFLADGSKCELNGTSRLEGNSTAGLPNSSGVNYSTTVGGAVCKQKDAKLDILDTTLIKDNKSGAGGGVCVDNNSSKSSSDLMLDDKVNITENTNTSGDKDNLKLVNALVLGANASADEMRAGVSGYDSATLVIAQTDNSLLENCFSSDVTNKVVKYNEEERQIELVESEYITNVESLRKCLSEKKYGILATDIGTDEDPIKSSLTVGSDKDVEINLNGHSINLNGYNIEVSSGKDLTITNEIEDNSASGSKEAVYGKWIDGKFKLVGSEVTDCKFDNGGVIYNGYVSVKSNSTFNMASGYIAGATSEKALGAIYCESDSSKVYLKDTGVVFNHNVAIYNKGTVSLTGKTSISGNEAELDGVAIYNAESKAAVYVTDQTKINDNIANNKKGAIYNNKGATVDIGSSDVQINNNTAYYGGAIYNNDSTLKISGGSISGNESESHGGAIYNKGSSSVLDIDCGSSSVAISNNKSSGDGAAIYNNSGKVTINNNTTIEKNVATGNGGAIWSSATVQISGAEVNLTKNTAKNGGALYVKNGSCSLAGQKSTESSSYGLRIEDNEAVVGGAMYINSVDTSTSGVSISGANSIMNNRVKTTDSTSTYGAGIYAKKGFTVGGLTNITSNTDLSRDGSNSNAYLCDGVIIDINSENELQGSAKISVASANGEAVFTRESTDKYKSFFTADAVSGKSYGIALTDNKALAIAESNAVLTALSSEGLFNLAQIPNIPDETENATTDASAEQAQLAEEVSQDDSFTATAEDEEIKITSVDELKAFLEDTGAYQGVNEATLKNDISFGCAGDWYVNATNGKTLDMDTYTWNTYSGGSTISLQRNDNSPKNTVTLKNGTLKTQTTAYKAFVQTEGNDSYIFDNVTIINNADSSYGKKSENKQPFALHTDTARTDANTVAYSFNDLSVTVNNSTFVEADCEGAIEFNNVNITNNGKEEPLSKDKNGVLSADDDTAIEPENYSFAVLGENSKLNIDTVTVTSTGTYPFIYTKGSNNEIVCENLTATHNSQYPFAKILHKSTLECKDCDIQATLSVDMQSKYAKTDSNGYFENNEERKSCHEDIPGKGMAIYTADGSSCVLTGTSIHDCKADFGCVYVGSDSSFTLGQGSNIKNCQLTINDTTKAKNWESSALQYMTPGVYASLNANFTMDASSIRGCLGIKSSAVVLSADSTDVPIDLCATDADKDVKRAQYSGLTFEMKNGAKITDNAIDVSANKKIIDECSTDEQSQYGSLVVYGAKIPGAVDNNITVSGSYAENVAITTDANSEISGTYAYSTATEDIKDVFNCGAIATDNDKSGSSKTVKNYYMTSGFYKMYDVCLFNTDRMPNASKDDALKQVVKGTSGFYTSRKADSSDNQVIKATDAELDGSGVSFAQFGGSGQTIPNNSIKGKGIFYSDAVNTYSHGTAYDGDEKNQPKDHCNCYNPVADNVLYKQAFTSFVNTATGAYVWSNIKDWKSPIQIASVEYNGNTYSR